MTVARALALVNEIFAFVKVLNKLPVHFCHVWGTNKLSFVEQRAIPYQPTNQPTNKNQTTKSSWISQSQEV